MSRYCGAMRREVFRALMHAIQQLVRSAMLGFVLCGSAGSGGAPVCSPPPEGVLAWVAAEDSARELVGRLGGEPRFEGAYSPGRVGQAFEFPGICCSGWVLEGGDPVPLPDFTAEAWIQGGGPGRFLGTIASGGDGVFHFLVRPDGNLLLSRVWGVEVKTPPVPQDAEWHHVAVAREGSQVRFFVDGALVATRSQAAPGAVLRQLTVGHVQPGGGAQFLGRIDEFALYIRALGADEIAAIHLAGMAGKCLVDAGVRFEGLGDRVPAGSTLPVTLVVTNLGHAPIRDLTVVSVLPAGATASEPVVSRGNVEAGAAGIRWRLEGLPSAEGAVLTYRLQAPGTAGFLSHEARLTTGSAEVNATNNLATGLTEFVGPCRSAPEGLAAWWAGEDSTCERVTATFATGAREDPEAYPVFYGAGRVGRGFDPSGGHNPVPIPNQFGVPIAAHTVEAWIRRKRIDRLNDVGAPSSAIFAYLTGDQLVLEAGGTVVARLSEFGPQVVGNAAIRDTAWHHIALSRNGSTVRLYLDGAAIGSGELPLPSAPSPQVAFAVPGSFLGLVDEVALYRRALEPTEIAAIYAAAGAGKCFEDVALAFAQPQFHGRTGEVYRLTLAVTNSGIAPAPRAMVTLRVPSGVEILGVALSRGTGEVREGAIRLDLGDLAAGAAVDVTVDARANRRAVFEWRAEVAQGGRDLSAANDIAAMEVSLHERCAPPPEGLLGWWPAEGTPADALGLVSGVTDSVRYEAGFAGQAFDFSQGGVIRFGNPAAWQVQDLTLESWVRTRTPPQSPGSVSGGTVVLFGGGPGCYTWGVDAQGQMQFGRAGEPLAASPAIHWDEAWHHLAVTKAGREVTFFLDGEAIGTADLDATFVFDHLFVLGGPTGLVAGESSPDASLDELALYGRAMGAHEIRRLADRFEKGKCREDVAVEASGVPARLPAGQDAALLVQIRNWGFEPATSVVLTSTLPASLQVLGVEVSQGTATVGETGVVANLGTLQAESAATLTLRFRSRQAGAITFPIAASRGEPDFASATDTATVAFEAVPLVVSIPETLSTTERLSPASLLVPVTLSVPSSQAVRVRYVIESGTATAGRDFRADDGELVFAPGMVEQQIPLRVINDLVDEGDETLRILLAGGSGAAVAGAECRVTIADDDEAPALTVGAAMAPEGSDTNSFARLEVFLVGRSEREVSADFTTSDLSAVAGRDYVSTSGRLLLAPGESRTVVEVRILGNSEAGTTRSFAVQLSNPTQAVLGDAVGVVTILDDDPQLGGPDGFAWQVPATATAVGVPFAAGLGAVDAQGVGVGAYAGSVSVSAEPADQPSSVLLTLVDLGFVDRVELQNVSSHEVDLSGWNLIFYDGRTWPAPAATFTFPPGTLLTATNTGGSGSALNLILWRG